MANNYMQSSSFLTVPPEHLEQAKEIITRIEAELEDDDHEGYVGVKTVVKDKGVWFTEEESITMEHAVDIAQALIDELPCFDETTRFVMSYCYYCSKPRIDDFGGGAVLLRKNKQPEWFDAANLAEQHERGE